MTTTFHSLEGWTETDSSSLQLPRTQALVRAVNESQEFRLLSCHVRDDAEAIVIEVTCPEVPSRNPVGIRTRERMAVRVRNGSSALPVVQMLRMEFPHVMHINGTARGAPRELCLYFEPPLSVMRTWTAPQFLQRIQWWLTSTANETLHAADQPLELPFFSSGWELVLPQGFEKLRSTPGQRFMVQSAGSERRNGALTLRLVPGQSSGQNSWGFACIRSTALHQGRTIDLPETLGGLAEDLNGRGVDFIGDLRAQLIEQLTASGEKTAADGNRFVILLELPVTRNDEVTAERTQRVGFLLAVGKLELGLRIGAYIRHQGDTFRFNGDVPGATPQEGDWQSLQMLPSAVLDAPDAARLRAYSGTDSPGPAGGVLLGAGALGSALVDLWSREGWGTWTVVDSDHIKPHNIARHRAFDGFVGDAKATFAKEISSAISPPGIVREAVVADACDVANEALSKALDVADVIVDCTTTLEFPRLASTAPHAGRHVSMFLAPSGRASVLLLEDTARACRLNSLEAQYYRAVINRPWGRDHLKGNLSTFWSGASCRDITATLDYSSVLVHASTLNQQLQRRLKGGTAQIGIWQRDHVTGAIEMHEVPVFAAHEGVTGNLKVRFDGGLVQRLRAMREQHLPKETGGIVLGYFDLNLGELVLVDALTAPPDSEHSTSHFIRGVDGVVEAVDEARRRTASIVGYVGEWHSHPRGHGASPSRDDFVQLHRLADVMGQDGLPILQVIVGEGEISFQIFGDMLR